VDGQRIFFTPELVIQIQEALGSDIAMVLDDCPPPSLERSEVEQSLELTLDWARQSKSAHRREEQLLFGIVQGGRFPDLRKEALERTCDIGFDGYALGGVSVGESHEEIERVIRDMGPLFPEERPRYLMGIGTPLDLFMGVEAGFDLFDCVNPTRYARNGTAFTRQGKLVVRDAPFREDQRPLDETCSCYACRTFSRSYIRHLVHAKEILGCWLLTYHNVYFFLALMREIRAAVQNGCFTEFKKEFETNYEDLADGDDGIMSASRKGDIQKERVSG
jgi:queuine tRNA-ribosyltransferase